MSFQDLYVDWLVFSNQNFTFYQHAQIFQQNLRLPNFIKIILNVLNITNYWNFWTGFIFIIQWWSQTALFCNRRHRRVRSRFLLEGQLSFLKILTCITGLSGFNVRSKTVPTPGSDLTVKSPPNYKAILLLMLSPSPWLP